MKNPLLTIAIPTYNREKSLVLLLESIRIQLTTIGQAELEILIFDNNSTDNTRAVVENFSSVNRVIKYHKNEENIGSDNNFVKAFNSARGQYLWMLGDDELLFDGSISWALKLCREQDFGCAYLSSIPETFSKIDGFLGYSVDTPVEIKKFHFFEFAQAINYRITFLSGSIVNRHKLIESNPQIHQDIERYSKSNLVHLTWIFSAVCSSPFSYFVETPMFAATIANSGGYSPVKVFVANLSEIFGHYFSKKNSKAKDFIRRIALIGWFPKVVFDIRFTNKYESTGYKIDMDQFPEEMQCGLNWWIFNQMVVKGSKPVSFIGMLYLKSLHKLTQKILLLRGKSMAV